MAALGIGREDWVPMTLFCGKTAQILAKPLGACNDEEKLYRYHIQSMRLFCGSCLGRNRMCTDYLLTQAETLGLAYSDLFATVQNGGLPPFYRGIVADVIVALYIDREPNEVINPVDRIRIWQAVDPPVELRAKKAKVDPFKNFPNLRPSPGFPDFKAYFLSFYEGTGGQFAKDPNMNSLIATMIRISMTFLGFGFYHNEHNIADREALALLMDPLIDLLDGRKDGADESRFVFSSTTEPIWDARLNILKILEFAFDVRVDKRLEMTYAMYEEAMDRGFAKGQLPSMVGDADQVASDLAFSAAPWTMEAIAQLNEDLFNKPLVPTKRNKLAMSPDLDNPPNLVKILLDNTQPDCTPLNVFALSLLSKLNAEVNGCKYHALELTPTSP